MYRTVLFSAIVALLIAGCATYPKTEKLATLTPGITRQQLSEHLDGAKPVSTQYIDGRLVLKYMLRNRFDIRYDIGHYFIFDQNDLLVGWEEEPQSQTSGGTSLLIPVYLRQ